MSAFTCLHPVTIHNSRGTFKVPCGKCPACLNRKANTLTNQCLIESNACKHTMFITLTYSDDNLPLCKVVRTPYYWHFVNCSERFSSGVLQTCPLGDFDSDFFIDYYKKLNLHSDYYGFIPYLNFRDLQLFLKRLRKLISKFYDQKIRYYAVGEYGPVHFRPHFHLLLFLDSDALASQMREFVHTCWDYGFTDCQYSKGGTASYCAKYVNCTSHLSAIQQLSFARPRATHSRFFAASFYKDAVAETPSRQFTDYVGRFVRGPKKDIPVSPWLSFESSIYPRCFKYGETDCGCRLFLYTAYSRVSKDFGDTQITCLVNALCDCHFNGNFFGWLKEFHDIFDSFYNVSTIDSLFSSILYTSKKFIKLCQTYSLSPSDYLRVIDDYYSSKDYFNLCHQLQDQSDYMLRPDAEPLMLLFWYSNFFLRNTYKSWCLESERCDILDRLASDPFCDRVTLRKRLLQIDSDTFSYPKYVSDYIRSLGVEPLFVDDNSLDFKSDYLYRDFSTRSLKKYRDSVKHKTLQDSNQIFCYGKHNVYVKRS